MKFEYLIKQDVSGDQLNELGSLGWELITSVKYTGSTELIFKRPLEKSAEITIEGNSRVCSLVEDRFGNKLDPQLAYKYDTKQTLRMSPDAMVSLNLVYIGYGKDEFGLAGNFYLGGIKEKEYPKLSKKLIKNTEKWEEVVMSYHEKHSKLGEARQIDMDQFLVFLAKNYKSPKEL